VHRQMISSNSLLLIRYIQHACGLAVVGSALTKAFLECIPQSLVFIELLPMLVIDRHQE